MCLRWFKYSPASEVGKQWAESLTCLVLASILTPGCRRICYGDLRLNLVVSPLEFISPFWWEDRRPTGLYLAEVGRYLQWKTPCWGFWGWQRGERDRKWRCLFFTSQGYLVTPCFPTPAMWQQTAANVGSFQGTQPNIPTQKESRKTSQSPHFLMQNISG